MIIVNISLNSFYVLCKFNLYGSVYASYHFFCRKNMIVLSESFPTKTARDNCQSSQNYVFYRDLCNLFLPRLVFILAGQIKKQQKEKTT